MGDVVFLSRSRRQGNKGVKGPVSGFNYVITVHGTPVSVYDVDELTKMTEPPCCGQSLPFGGEVKSFGIAVPTSAQLKTVPQFLWDFEPESEPEPEDRPRKRRYTRYVEPEPEEPEDVEPVGETETNVESNLVEDWGV